MPDPPLHPGPSSDVTATPRDTLGSNVVAPGTTLGRYLILEPLGAGGMGVVYRARDQRLERDVAIKLLLSGMLEAGNDAHRRFHKEALALARLSHPHIAAIYDVGQQDQLDYIVMECIAGQSLAALLRSGPLPVKDATSIVLQIAQALEEAHELGIIHRDLKPGNVMITPRSQVKVLDFGIAKLLDPAARPDATRSLETFSLVGTLRYMSPEQAEERTLDARSDLWSLGVLYFELLTGSPPFSTDTPIALLRAILERHPPTLRSMRPDAPEAAEAIVTRALKKDPGARYQTASAFAADTSELLAQLTGSHTAQTTPASGKTSRLWIAGLITLLVCFAAAAALWLHRSSQRTWAREQAPAQFDELIAAQKPLAAQAILSRAQQIFPGDAPLAQLAAAHTVKTSVTSTPSNAKVEIQDYLTPDGPWHILGNTPLRNVAMPKGYFRWRVSAPGAGELVTAPETNAEMNFPLEAAHNAPAGMGYAAASTWGDYLAFIGWVGPYELPAFYIDRLEVTNREYQAFVDAGGYDKPAYWPSELAKANPAPPSAQFRDITGRPGPATWVAGHFPEGKADFPVSGVSWYEASAYAAYADKQLPVLAQWYSAAPPDVAAYTVQLSNLSTSSLATAGAAKGIGPFGTDDMAGNVREWVANPVDNKLHFILGGSWQSPAYLYSSPEALSPFDRSPANGVRCVRNLGPLGSAAAPVTHLARDFTHFKPVPDEVFRAYTLLYRYNNQAPLNVEDGGTVRETQDWREEKISFDAAYNGERMSAYLFLPKTVKPPYQTILFFPSARVTEIPSSEGGRELGDIKFFDYILQSGRAVMYPIYEETYERRLKNSMPGASQPLQLTTNWYKDAARTLDYLATRPDIDNTRLGYLGVSMGSADGAILVSLLQPRLKTAIFLDGGYFLDRPTPGGDQAEFVSRIRIPTLMVNGRYDFTFPLEQAQNPFFAMLSTPAADKSHVVLDTPHDVTQQRPQLVHAVLDWLDRYLGHIPG